MDEILKMACNSLKGAYTAYVTEGDCTVSLKFRRLAMLSSCVALRAVSLGLTDFKVVIYLLQAGLDKINSHFKIFQFFQN